MALSNADKVKLMLNGKLIGEQQVDKYEMNSWDVPYLPGKLEAIGYKNGKEVSRFKAETTGEPVSIQLIADRNAITGDGWDAVPVTVQVLDAKGLQVPTANLPIQFEVSGDGSLIGVGNGDPNSHASEKTNQRDLYNGLAQLIIQSKEGGKSPVNITATSPGLKSATIQIAVKSAENIPSVSDEQSPFIISYGWRISPFSNQKPDPNQELSDNDMNSWDPTRAGQLQDFKGGNFAVYRASFKPHAAERTNGGKLVLQGVTGKAEVWINRKLVAVKIVLRKQIWWLHWRHLSRIKKFLY